MTIALTVSAILNVYLLYFIAKRYFYSKVPPVLWTFDIAILGDSHVERGNWSELIGCPVANFGKGKSTVEEMYHRLPGVLRCKPKVCFVHGGINDIFYRVKIPTTITYYTKIITALKRAGIQPVIILTMKYSDTTYDNAVDHLNGVLKTLAPCIDPGVLYDDLEPDGLHMRGSGYSKWALAIMDYMQG